MKTNVVVIGSGPGGYVAAIRCAQRGLNVTIIEKENIGGVCLNVGCIPTKALFKNASFIKDLNKSQQLGVQLDGFEIKFNQMIARKDMIVKQLTGAVKQLLKKNKIKIINGIAKVYDSETVEVIIDNEVSKINCDYIIIATGSTPILPPIPGVDLEGVMTSKELLSVDTLPDSMAIVGGGVIGMEFASIFSTLGVDVTVIERLPSILPNFDVELTTHLREILEGKGVKIRTSTELKSIVKKNQELVLDLGDDEICVDRVLMSVGRKPVLPEMINIDIDSDGGAIVVNEYLQTNIPNIYCIGDSNGKYQLAHVASAEAIVAADHMTKSSDRKMCYKGVPSVVYTLPEIASVGLSEEEAKSRGNIKTGRFNYNANGKALCMDETTGFAKIITGSKHKEVQGLHIIGYDASNLIAEGGLALELEATVGEICETIHAHPSLSEIIMECSEEVEFRGIHSF